MKTQYLCYKFMAQTFLCVLTIEHAANVVIHADNCSTFKFKINPSNSHSTNHTGVRK